MLTIGGRDGMLSVPALTLNRVMVFPAALLVAGNAVGEKTMVLGLPGATLIVAAAARASRRLQLVPAPVQLEATPVASSRAAFTVYTVGAW